jgi:hypothetical protein
MSYRTDFTYKTVLQLISLSMDRALLDSALTSSGVVEDKEFLF